MNDAVDDQLRTNLKWGAGPASCKYVQMKRQEKTKALRDIKAQMQALLDEKESMAGESQELTKQKAKLELNIKDLKDEEAGHKSSKVCIKYTTSGKNVYYAD